MRICAKEHFGSGLRLLLRTILICLIVSAPSAFAAQEGEDAGKVQILSGRLEPGAEKEVYRLDGLQAGDTVYATMQATSGNLDPFLAVLDMTTDFGAFEAKYQADIQQLLVEDGEISLSLRDLRDRTFLRWDDDSGEGYAAALEFPITASGDYYLIAGSSLSATGRNTWGDYELLIGLNEPKVLDGAVQPTGEVIAVFDPQALGMAASVSEISGKLSVEQPVAVLDLVDIQPGVTMYAYVEAVDGNLRPAVILRDYGGKPLEAANLNGRETVAVLEFLLPEESIGYSLEISGASSGDSQPTTGEFRALVGLNSPEVLAGEAAATEQPVLMGPIEVQAGVQIDRISEVDSAGENFTVIGDIRIDWRDPNLAFSPDSCDCDVKLYSEGEFNRFLSEASSRWPDFTFFNQLGNRWVENREVAVWPDGRARYVERFTTDFQVDFDFQKYPFDVQQFPIILDMTLPSDVYDLVELPGYSAISPDHGEDEFIVGEIETRTETVVKNATADRAIDRLIFNFSAPRHLDYYLLQVFVPILLIIAISWFTFFLKDYTRRIEASAANILLFIAFSFSLANNYPRLGYITFLDAIMAVAFIVNALVLLYNVQMKRLETKGEIERVERIDNFLDWAYPLAYLILIAAVGMFFFGRG